MVLPERVVRSGSGGDVGSPSDEKVSDSDTEGFTVVRFRIRCVATEESSDSESESRSESVGTSSGEKGSSPSETEVRESIN